MLLLPLTPLAVLLVGTHEAEKPRTKASPYQTGAVYGMSRWLQSLPVCLRHAGYGAATVSPFKASPPPCWPYSLPEAQLRGKMLWQAFHTTAKCHRALSRDCPMGKSSWVLWDLPLRHLRRSSSQRVLSGGRSLAPVDLNRQTLSTLAQVRQSTIGGQRVRAFATGIKVVKRQGS